MKKMNRRKFISKTGKFTFFGAIAWSFIPVVKKLAFATYSTAGFNFYNEANPHVKSMVARTFKDCLNQGFVPRIYYKTSKPIVSVAKGIVTEIAKVGDASAYWKRFRGDPEKAKGFRVSILHGTNYKSVYLHLKLPTVILGEKVKRGQIIGVPDERWKISSLIFLEETYSLVDPENYGFNHSFMNYWDGVTSLDISNEEQNKRLVNQKELLYKLVSMYTGSEKYMLINKKHRSNNKIFRWSMPERFRYLEHLYQQRPQSFTSLSKGQFEEMRQQFHDNQPIILTLPFEKG